LYTETQAALLGVVQGITEFLPVSSSAHLVIVPWALGWPTMENSMDFDVALHIGTVLAMGIFFFFDWAMILASYIGDLRQGNWKGGKMGGLLPKIILSCIPAAVVGLFFEQPLEDFFYNDRRHLWILSITMSVFGVVLMMSERYGKQNRDVPEITYKDALFIGCFQVLALIPGTSRSGITIVAALLLGLKRPAAARFSFLAALPITVGAVILKIDDLQGVTNWTPVIIGIVTSGVVGILAIKFLLKYVQHRRYDLFAWYRIAFAVGVLVLFFTSPTA